MAQENTAKNDSMNDMTQAFYKALKLIESEKKTEKGVNEFKLLETVVLGLSDLKKLNTKEKDAIKSALEKNNNSTQKILKDLAKSMAILVKNNQSSINKSKVKGLTEAEAKNNLNYRKSFSSTRFENMSKNASTFYENIKDISKKVSASNKSLRNSISSLKSSTEGITESAITLSDLAKDASDLSKILGKTAKQQTRTTSSLLGNALSMERDVDWLTQITKNTNVIKTVQNYVDDYSSRVGLSATGKLTLSDIYHTLTPFEIAFGIPQNRSALIKFHFIRIIFTSCRFKIYSILYWHDISILCSNNSKLQAAIS